MTPPTPPEESAPKPAPGTDIDLNLDLDPGLAAGATAEGAEAAEPPLVKRAERRALRERRIRAQRTRNRFIIGIIIVILAAVFIYWTLFLRR